MYNDLMSTETLTTFIGLVAATSLIVQFTKSVIKRQLGDGYVRFYAFVIALIFMLILPSFTFYGFGLRRCFTRKKSRGGHGCGTPSLSWR